MSAVSTQSNRPRIVVLGDLERALPRLADWRSIHARADLQMHHEPLAGPALVEALKDADVAVLVRDRTPFDAALLAQLPKLRYLVFTGTRNTTLDAAALAARNIPVSHTEWGPSKDSTCEMTWALILAAPPGNWRRKPRCCAVATGARPQPKRWPPCCMAPPWA